MNPMGYRDLVEAAAIIYDRYRKGRGEIGFDECNPCSDIWLLWGHAREKLAEDILEQLVEIASPKNPRDFVARLGIQTEKLLEAISKVRRLPTPMKIALWRHLGLGEYE